MRILEGAEKDQKSAKRRSTNTRQIIETFKVN